MIRIGITGGIGSGKSTVRDFLQRRGATVFDADREARQLMTDDVSLKSKLIDVLGEHAYLEDGSLNRPFISGLIFSSEELRRRIDTLVHPEVFKKFSLAAEEAESAGAVAIVREAAILPPPELMSELDIMIVVKTKRAERVLRVEKRDATTVGEIEKRAAAQASDQEFEAVADILIENDGSLEELERKVDEVWAMVLAGKLPSSDD